MNTLRPNAFICIVVFVFSAKPQSITAQCPHDWQPGQGLPGVDGAVYAMTTWDPDGGGPLPELLVVGGAFNVAGSVIANDIAAWDGSQWHTFGTGMTLTASAFSEVRALTVYNGALIAGGRFSNAGGVPCSNIARWDGFAWHSVGGGTDNTVESLTVFNGELIVGGWFALAGGAPASAIAAWNGAQWHGLDVGMSSSTGYGPAVLALGIYDDDLIVGGFFHSAGPVSATGIARWNGSAWQSLGDSGLWSVRALAVVDSELIAASSYSINRWNGTSWEEPCNLVADSTCGSAITALTVYEGNVVAISNTYWGDPSWACGFVGGNLWTDCGVVDSTDEPIHAMAVYNGQLVTVGRRFVRWNGSALSGWTDIRSETTNGSVSALSTWNDGLVAAGYFTVIDGMEANRIARRTGTTWEPLGIGFDEAGAVSALAEYGGDLIAAGSFSSAGGAPARNIARWDGVNWHSLESGTESSINDLAVFGSELIACGFFTEAGGVSANNVARWNGSQWQSLGSGMNWQTSALTVFNGALIAGGGFSNAGGVAASRIASWNGTQWTPVGTGMGGDGAWVNVLTVFNNDLIAGGRFASAGGVAANNIARWDGSNWAALGAGLNDSVYALLVHGNKLYVGGAFSLAGGQSASQIARWDGSVWQPLGAGTSNAVIALGVFDGDLIAGGSFTTAGEFVSPYVARFGPACPGDLNCDNVVDMADVPHFINALLATGFTGCDINRADMNQDGQINGRDIHPFTLAVAAP